MSQVEKKQEEQKQEEKNQTQVGQRQTLEQERAKKAWEQVSKVAGNKEYLSAVRGAPALILSCGLGQTIAFYCSKGGAQKTLGDHLAEWLLRNAQSQSKSAEALLNEIMNNDSARYRQLTSEAMAYLVWLKRFADAHNKDKQKNSQTDGKEQETESK